jgi:hypothetical protein
MAEGDAEPQAETGAIAPPPPNPDTVQKPLQPPSTQEDAAKERTKAKAEAASKGPTATLVDTPKAPGPGVAPHPRKPNLFKRLIGRFTGKK